MSEDVVEMYQRFAAQAKAKTSKGAKADTIRNFVTDLGAAMSTDTIVLAAAYNTAKDVLGKEKVDRSYFNNVVSKAWEVSKDDDGISVVDLSRPKSKSK